MLTERHLEIFVALAEEEHFGAAAQRVGITQPPLSQGLRRLEALLGVRLFERERGVFLTEEGALLLPHARKALAALAGLRETGAHEHADGRRLRLGLAPEVPAPLAADVAAAPVRAGDRARISTVTAPTASLLSDVASGRLDLAVIRHPSVLHGLAAGQVVLLPTWILTPAGSAGPGGVAGPDRVAESGGGAEAGGAAVRRLPVAVRPRGEAPAAHDLFVDTLASRGRRVETVVVADERAGLALVAAGQAVLVTADGTLTASRVERRRATDPPLPLRLRVVWNPRRSGAAPEDPAATARLLESALAEGAAR
ncbi:MULTISPECIES: LysR family transcriptional regulator [unclassified Streptomyces]|uniref:LysR family transcriptional regulator n=1 Tax=unclassified Streptomyces TaxID=2593676 RepID=UPI000823F5DC|nr:LysR family transcriptional regulator [Streptomyces sp. AmelKG-D3]MYT98778.1 LysR family transcriptional regulator [Streptomyces sp. SID8350]SCK21990.1 DNA-binding transcriptional regulator, LysR family [Streptomyces sp. AmelKG-D3]